MVNLVQCEIHVQQKVQGPVYISSCREVTVHTNCHQLRMHESFHLIVHATVGSTPILEGCRDIILYVRKGDNITRNVQDFHWLRQDAPSPNVHIKEKGSDTDVLPIELASPKLASPGAPPNQQLIKQPDQQPTENLIQQTIRTPTQNPIHPPMLTHGAVAEPTKPPPIEDDEEDEL
mmetsp:Transcript_630/g.1477  ORF Transcript_630/g.1477 Transcript_630/m.1477 type:complete len:176 (-) Transcript_630:1439-1966(-)